MRRKPKPPNYKVRCVYKDKNAWCEGNFTPTNRNVAKYCDSCRRKMPTMYSQETYYKKKWSKK